MSLDVRNAPLKDLLSGDTPFNLARYQRRYEWTISEMEQLLSDLMDAFRSHQSTPGKGEYYFLGSIIILEPPKAPVLLVDGQQRLISLSMILAAARDLAADGAQSRFIDAFLTIPANPLTGTAAMQRLVLHRGDNEFFQSAIVRQGATRDLVELARQDHEGADRMRRNGARAIDWLSDLGPTEIALFVQFISANCRVVVIRVTDEDEAFQIFETVNSRGRPISADDVLRYALVELATSDSQKRDELLELWDALEEELGPAGMKAFVNQWRTQLLAGRQPSRSLARDITSSFATPEDALAFIETRLSQDVATYRMIAEGNSAVADPGLKSQADKLLLSLSLTNFDDWRPAAHILLDRLAANPEMLTEGLRKIERLAWYFYFSIDAKGIAKERRTRFGEVVAGLLEKGGRFEEVPAIELTPAEKAKMRDILQERIDPKWGALRSLLVRIEMALAPENLRLPRDSITIEHVLPQNPRSEEWLAPFDGDRRVVRDYAQRLGNVCAVPEPVNTRLGNKRFKLKREIMIDQGVTKRFATARDVEKEKSWTKSVIERRTKWLVSVLCEEFAIHAQSTR